MSSTRSDIILSASAISTLKKCPWKYRNAYHLGIRRIEEPDALRIGTNWHEGLELMSLKPEQPCLACANKARPDQNCNVCDGTGFVADPLDSVSRVLSSRYESWYPNVLRDAAEVERVTLLYSLFAYNYHYNGDQVTTIQRELPFRIPLVDPDTHQAVPGVFLDGKIDKLVRQNGRIMVMEHKSTSDSVAPDSDYWGHLRLDTQTMIYPYACQRLITDGILDVKQSSIGEVLYDVWHKPQISPKKLSQADTTAFIESGEYFGRSFEIACADDGNRVIKVEVDHVSAEIETMKKGFAIRETPEMFGCRLFADYDARPDYYFARRILTRTSEDLARFERELFSLYTTIRDMAYGDSWYHNENSCDTYGKCDYCQFCFTGQELDPEKPPAGFKNISMKGK